MKRTYASTSPDGKSTANRTTERTYTHAVWIRRTEAGWRRELHQSLDYCRRDELGKKARVQDIEQGTPRPSWDGVYENGVKRPYTLGEAIKLLDDCRKALDAKVLELLDGFQGDDWGCVAYCGRPDLAMKECAKYTKNGWWEAQAVPVAEVPKGSKR